MGVEELTSQTMCVVLDTKKIISLVNMLEMSPIMRIKSYSPGEP